MSLPMPSPSPSSSSSPLSSTPGEGGVTEYQLQNQLPRPPKVYSCQEIDLELKALKIENQIIYSMINRLELERMRVVGKGSSSGRRAAASSRSGS